MAPVRRSSCGSCSNGAMASFVTSVFLAGRTGLQHLDLGSGALTDAAGVPRPLAVACMRMAARTLYCGTAAGDIVAYDPRTRGLVARTAAHRAGVAALDVCGDRLASFGFPSPADPFVKVFDVRMNKVVAVVPVDAPPLALRFHPALAHTLAVADQAGVVVLADTGGSSSASPEPHMQLGCGAQVTAFDLCATGDAFVVGDMVGHAHVHPEKDSDFCVCDSLSHTHTSVHTHVSHCISPLGWWRTHTHTVQRILAGHPTARETRAARGCAEPRRERHRVSCHFSSPIVTTTTTTTTTTTMTTTV